MITRTADDETRARARSPLHLTPRPALVAALLALATLAVGIAWNTRAAGGSDSYGYVSQAYVWLAGGPPVAEPLAREIRVRDAAWVSSPLGYRPGLQAGEIVPIYPPGLPLLMASAIGLVGPAGAFLIAPLAGAAAVWCTYLLGRRVATPLIGLGAAALLATNPTFLYQLVQPMSDVPVTALWTASLVLACAASTRAWIAAGACAAVAILVRPNLAPLAGAVALVAVCGSAEGRRATLRSLTSMLAAVLVPALAATVVVLWANHAWYGSYSASGYGTARQLFSVSHVWPNVVRYARALAETNALLVAIAVVAAVILALRGRARLPGPLVASVSVWCGAVLALYLPYLSFPEWWYTRFLLPAFPATFVLLLVLITRAAEPWRVPRVAAAILVACAMATGVWIAHDRGAFDLARVEAKYEDAGRRVHALLPPAAVVLAMQHSGSIRFYGHRPTLRWDLLRADDLDGLVGRLARQGRPCFAVLEPEERDRFLLRFSATHTVRDARASRLFATPYGIEVLALIPATRTR